MACGLLFAYFIIFLGDGIFDKMTSHECLSIAQETARRMNSLNIHEKCGKCVDAIMKRALVKRTQDNITVVILAFQNFNQLTYATVKS